MRRLVSRIGAPLLVELIGVVAAIGFTQEVNPIHDVVDCGPILGSAVFIELIGGHIAALADTVPTTPAAGQTGRSRRLGQNGVDPLNLGDATGRVSGVARVRIPDGVQLIEVIGKVDIGFDGNGQVVVIARVDHLVDRKVLILIRGPLNRTRRTRDVAGRHGVQITNRHVVARTGRAPVLICEKEPAFAAVVVAPVRHTEGIEIAMGQPQYEVVAQFVVIRIDTVVVGHHLEELGLVVHGFGIGGLGGELEGERQNHENRQNHCEQGGQPLEAALAYWRIPIPMADSHRNPLHSDSRRPFQSLDRSARYRRGGPGTRLPEINA